MISRPHNTSLHTIALLTTAATFPLIFMGGLVTSHGAGMSVPDWPNSYGYNMFLFPPHLWIGGIFYEHTHRLMGTVVGFFSLLLALVAWGVGKGTKTRRFLLIGAGAAGALAIAAAMIALLHIGNETTRRLMPHITVGFVSLALVMTISLFARAPEPRQWVRWLSLGVLTAVIVQGIFGGTRVTQVNLTLAIIHGCFAQAFFCLAALFCVVTSQWWANAPDLSLSSPRAGHGLTVLAIASVVAVYLQLTVGAVMRHEHAGLAIPDLPFAYGKLLPPSNAADLQAANAQLAKMVYQASLTGHQADLSLPTQVTFFQVWIHFAHRVGALAVSAFVLATAWMVLRKFRQQRKLLGPAVHLLFLIAAQLTLGVLTVLLRKPADLASAHVATGALLLVTCFVLSIRAARLYSPLFRHGRPGFPAIERSQQGQFPAKAEAEFASN